jgi:photosystem II stability/assembly factor-like uncharacterized protein
MLRKLLLPLSILSALLGVSAIASAGVNTWTGGNPTATAQTFSLVSADPTDRAVVFGTFGEDLYRSRDGGHTWSRLRSFGRIQALLVHPASPSTIYVAGQDASHESMGVFKSADGGQTWTLALADSGVTVLAGSPADASTVFAGSYYAVYRTTDGGDTWTPTSVAGAISTLVLNPQNPSIVYAGAESDAGFGYYPGAFSRSDDGGSTFSDLTPESFGGARAAAVDPMQGSTVYLATMSSYYGVGVPGVVRSEDSGVSFGPPGDGLPDDVRSLVVNPRVSGTIYAGTGSGVYRSSDGGRSWTAFGLAGIPIVSLFIDAQGLRLHAGTMQGIYTLEIASGPLDVAPGPAGESRLLTLDSDRSSVSTLDASGRWTAGSFENASATWTATAVATSFTGDDRTHLLWQNGDGRSALEIVGATGRESVTIFAAEAGWMPADLSVRGDRKTSVLWTHADGRMRIATVDSSGDVSMGPEYGPAPGWSAVAIANGFYDLWPNVLWRSADGRSSLSAHRENGEMLSFSVWPADPGWSVQDITGAIDGTVRLLRVATDGTAEVSLINADRTRSWIATYGSPGLTPRAIAAGMDGGTRLLFSGEIGGDLLLLDAYNGLTARHAIPSANAATIVVTTAEELSAALVPANAGARILVSAGEYGVANPLTVPDGAILSGEGVMALDASKLPTGIVPAGRTALRAAADLEGDILTLGGGSVIRGLVIEDVQGRAAGNPVAVVSRAANDRVSARILECEIVNPNESGIASQGPTGRGLAVWTRNPNLGQDPPPHEGARLGVQMTRSIVRSPAPGVGVFAINFASRGRIDLDLDSNVIGGGVDADGGVSRPDAVTLASVTIASRRSLYRSDSPDPTPIGWRLLGGTTAPIPGLASQASTSNTLRLHSNDDRIEGFGTGISAIGATRFNPLSEPSDSNAIELNLQGTLLQTASADLELLGASTFVDGVWAGDGNSVHVVMRQSKGSGTRANVYANSAGNLGTGNKLEIAGSATAFAQTNEDIDPAPPAEFFTGE